MDRRVRLSSRTRTQILALLCATYFIVILDAAIVRVAIPAIDRDLGMSEQGLQWVANAYMVAFGGLLLLGGRAADLLGRRRMFIGGLVLFALASIWCGVAWSGGVLIAARAVQGVGAAAMTPAALSILMNTFAEGRARNRALGVWAVMGGLGATAGWIIGGPLTDGLGWQSVFWINVPIVAVVAFFALRLLPESRDLAREREYDPAGALSITAALVLGLYALAEAPGAGWASTQTISLFAVSVLLLAAFVVFERRSRAPLVPLWIFRSRLLVAANVGFALASASIYGMTYILALYGQQVLGYSALQFGYAGLVVPVTAAAGAMGAQAIVTRRGPQAISVLAMCVLAVAFVLLARLPVHGHYVNDLLPALVLFGPAVGAAFNAYTIATLMGIRPTEAGLAAGLNNTFEMVGGAVGTAVMATIAVAKTNHVQGPGVAARFALNEGFQVAFATGIAFALAGAVVSILFLKLRRPAPVDAFAYGLADPAFSEVKDELVAVQATAEREGVAPDELARRVREIADPYIERLRHDRDVIDSHPGKFFNHYTDDLQRVDTRIRPKGGFAPIPCETCGTLVDEDLAHCFVCGNPPRTDG